MPARASRGRPQSVVVMRQQQLHHSAIPEKTRRALESVLAAGLAIVEWTEGVNEHRLWADKQKRAAVERQFEVMAEALRRLQSFDSAIWGKIPDGTTAVKLGDAIRLNFDSIDYGILWRATRNEVPAMLREVESELAGAKS